MKIYPLSEGSFTIDKTKVFVPFDDEEHELDERSKGSLLVEVQPFLVVTSRDVILLDAGLGYSKNGSLQIYQNLEKIGFRPGQVTKVLMTHLHKDHAGGVSEKAGSGNYVFSFPQAKYYVQKQEMDFAFKTGFPSFIPEEIEMLRNNEQVEVLDGDGNIDNYIQYQLTGGHSPFHQVFWIEEEGEIIFFGGDEAPQLGQMKRKVVAKYDFDGKKANDWRQKWWEQGSKENWTFLFYHDVKMPIWPEAKL